MLWQVRALLEDRPGALAGLAASCGEEAVNVLALEVHPRADGRVVDEIVLSTAGGWSAGRVEQLVRRAGVVEAHVAPCSAQVLEDQPVRYMRAAERVMLNPLTLNDELRTLLDAGMGAHTLVLGDGDGDGPPVALTRSAPFTDSEAARARELRRLAGLASGSTVEAPGPDARRDVTVRRGTCADVAALIAMHSRCSSETLYRRFHSPVRHLGARVARELLEPDDGFSVVLTAGRAVVGCGTVARAEGPYEVGLLVEDGWQGSGHGSRLLAGLVAVARARGASSLTCHVQPGNSAVPATIRRAGLRARAVHTDGVNTYVVAVDTTTAANPPGSRSTDEAVTQGATTGSATPPKEGAELREVRPGVDLLDEGVRSGA